MNNFDRLCLGVEEMADFIKLHTTCFVCPAHSGLDACEDCEQRIIEWLLEDCDNGEFG